MRRIRTQATYLDRIVTWHRDRAAADTRPLGELAERAATLPETRGFARALTASSGLAVIAEVKRRSPSRGDLRADLDPAALSATYARGGASALSVLTDEQFFAGSAADLAAARAATPLPVLRKDFTIGPRDVYDARAMGADAVLLIVAALSRDEVTELHALAGDVGLDVLVEVHDEEELATAVDAGATLIGVNQRDLVTFEVDPARAQRMAAAIAAGVVKVAESGVRGAADAHALAAAGYDAVLVGEALVTAPDPARLIRDLKGE
ncbi:MAG TPA: indole-3-glycerol phosphate synthase TrpC [Acidimicrobiales bacterium]|nr:indole-3-glycerol phosphate synthase TrpC [Acidimicrobiales bacterium]